MERNRIVKLRVIDPRFQHSRTLGPGEEYVVKLRRDVPTGVEDGVSEIRGGNLDTSGSLRVRVTEKRAVILSTIPKEPLDESDEAYVGNGRLPVFFMKGPKDFPWIRVAGEIEISE